MTSDEYAAIAIVTKTWATAVRGFDPCAGCDALQLCHPDATEAHFRLFRFGWERLARDHMYESHPDEYHGLLTYWQSHGGGAPSPGSWTVARATG